MALSLRVVVEERDAAGLLLVHTRQVPARHRVVPKTMYRKAWPRIQYLPHVTARHTRTELRRNTRWPDDHLLALLSRCSTYTHR
jgi:hypothetical protein